MSVFPNVDSAFKLISTLIILYLQTVSGLQNISAHLGQNVTLPCQASIHKHFIAVEWTRPDLRPELVLFYMDGYNHQKHQHSSFNTRVDLLDTQMKHGNLSLILRNVNSNDSGTYECRVKENDGRRRITRGFVDSQPISTIRLTVTESADTAGDIGNEGNKDGHLWLTVGLPVGVGAVLVVHFAGCVIYKKRRFIYKHPDQEGETQL